MIRFIDGTLEPFLGLLADWSIRWGVVILALAAWLRASPPRSAALRHTLCLTALGAGLILPLAPRWAIPWQRWAMAADRVSSPDRPSIPDPGRPAPPRPMMPDARTSTITPVPIVAEQPLRPEPPKVVAKPIGFWRWARLALGVAWLAGTLLVLIRLAVGWRVLARLRASARPIAIEVPDRASRGVALATHPAVGSPIVLGGRRPTILVPEGWDAMPEASRRACLLHEMAHLERRDDLAKLAGELARAPFWFHPAVAWLLARLDREAELACDEAAVGRGVPPRDLAELLLGFARKPARLDPAGLALRFFDRGTVAARIHRLLEDDMTRPPLAPSKPKAFALAATLAALALLIGGAGARAIEPRPQQPAPAPATKPEPKPEPTARSFSAIVRDEQGNPIEGATVIAGTLDYASALTSGNPFPQEKPKVDPKQDDVIVTGQFSGFRTPPDAEAPFRDEVRTGADGVARFDREPKSGIFLMAFKEGRAFTSYDVAMPEGPFPISLTLPPPRPFVGSVMDEWGRPVAGAEVRVEMVRLANTGRFDYFPLLEPFVRGTPIVARLAMRTGPNGTFRIEGLPIGSEAVATASAEGKATASTAWREDRPFVAGTEEDPVRLVLRPEARVLGRVVTELPGVSVANRVVTLRWASDRIGSTQNRKATTDAQGQFEFRGLGEGNAFFMLDDVPPDGPWTFAAALARMTPGQTAMPAILISRGVEVTGRVLTADDRPVPDAPIGVVGPGNPHPGGTPIVLRTDATGTYRIRLAPGAVFVNPFGFPPGFTLPGEQKPSVPVLIPQDVATFALEPIRMIPAAATIRGRIVDAAGAAMDRARVVGIRHSAYQNPIQLDAAVDAEGRFTLEPQVARLIPLDQPALFQVRNGAGRVFESWAVPNGRDEITFKLPTLRDGGPKGPEAVGPDEVAGVVVDAQGRPMEGVLADAYSWAPGNEARTDKDGRFRIKVPERGQIEIRLTRDGYEPREFTNWPTGQAGWVVAMGNSTYFEGRLIAPDGSPVADAPIRANSGGRRMGDGGIMQNCWTVGRSGPDGRYRLDVEPGMYEFELRVPGRGVARISGQAIAADEARALDLTLSPGVEFRANVVDAQTGEPVAGFTIRDWQNPGVVGTSDAAGVLRIPDMMPGPFSFGEVKSDLHARWWSDDGATEWTRFQAPGPDGFQRNIDGLDFDIRPGMAPVTIRVERAATIRGRVLDPDGKPVAGATVAPVQTGTGNSLTGDTRYSVETDGDGRFAMAAPAGKTFAYHLVAHDGKFRESRTWANGIVAPFRTEPGQVIEDVTIRLTRPATVRGRVLDSDGRPVAGLEVSATAADGMENRYYEPFTRTEADGSYTLRCIRAGRQKIRVNSSGTSREVTLAEGETREGIDLIGAPPGR